MVARKPTIHGQAAWAALIDHLGPTGAEWGPPSELRGLTDRGAYATQQAVIHFLGELRALHSRRIYLENGSTVPLSRARFRAPGDDPYMHGQEGVFGYGSASVSLYGLRGRMSASGVLELGDRWSDSVRFGTSSNADFLDCFWEADEWDLPEPVASISIADSAPGEFQPHATAIAQSVLDTSRTDRAAAEAAIRAHFRACRPYSAISPEIRWYDSPAAAVLGLKTHSYSASSVKKKLQDNALINFNHEVAVRLERKSSTLNLEIDSLMREAICYDTFESMLDWIVDQHVQSAFGFMGLVRSYYELAWYEFLRSNGLVLHDVASTFCIMTARVWLMFPTLHVVYAVERPSFVKKGAEDCTLTFGDGSSLRWMRYGGM